MSKAKVIFLLLLASLVIPLAFVLWRGSEKQGGELLLYCAAGMQKPVARIVEEYEKEYCVRVDVQYAGSDTLLGSIEASRLGDLYLAADSSYIVKAQKLGLAVESIPVSFLTAGLVVKEGNPHGIASLQDLLDKPGLRIGFGNPEQTAIGRFTRKVLSEAGLWDELEPRVLLFTPTVNELANAVKVDAIDVTVVWDAVASQYPDLEFIHVPEFDRERKEVTIGVLQSSKNPAAALRFARFLTARDRGLEVFAEENFEIREGDAWSPRPEIVLYSGAMLRPAILDRLEAFKAREGVDINLVPNGCGILVTQMKGGERPDAYFSCDLSFMEDVQDLFAEPVTVSANRIVLLVNKRKEGEIKSLLDLARPGVKVGLAHPDKSALGKLTQDLLAAVGLAEGVNANKTLDSATGDFLVNQLRAGSLDAVLVYESNARATPATLEEAVLIPIEHSRAIAYQPFAVGRSTKFPLLGDRLQAALTSPRARKDFEAIGFRWELDAEPETGGGD